MGGGPVVVQRGKLYLFPFVTQNSLKRRSLCEMASSKNWEPPSHRCCAWPRKLSKVAVKRRKRLENGRVAVMVWGGGGGAEGKKRYMWMYDTDSSKNLESRLADFRLLCRWYVCIPNELWLEFGWSDN